MSAALPPFKTADNLAAARGVRHGFFGREGGVSEGLYASLNVGLGSNDAPDAVRENRARCAQAVGAAPERLVTAYQIHSAAAVVADAPWETPPHADAMVTTTPGLALGVLAADCAPVLFADPDAKVIGAAHAGWKGAVTGVVRSAVDAMVRLGATRAGIIAAIGPCIRQPSYEVGDDFAARFDVGGDPASGRGRHGRFFTAGERPGKWLFDLAGFVRLQIEDAGVRAIETLPDCTYENETTYFSYRRTTHRDEPDYGRNLSAIVLEG
ncbi:MAG: peptidoglycan editing factor PgeF [Pseudomonadota bacterium]